MIPDCTCDELEPQIHQAVLGEWNELTSPGYPIPYCSDLVCVYRIVAPAGHHVVLNITEFYTEPYNDVLALFDGENTTGRHIDGVNALQNNKKWKIMKILIKVVRDYYSILKCEHLFE
ncbi:unnamed protein product [Cylicostephanus goldi]|uniref:CUB domain-containing protein n=1 Tax=Cylicostephanus goldi TaxID=71465 RepID=A0A3P6SDV9_CYLGO|nr:unnamed protein product [Cylicostephanus goldi]